jgi:hypothetical protein
VAGKAAKLCRVKAGETKSSALALLCLLAVFTALFVPCQRRQIITHGGVQVEKE